VRHWVWLSASCKFLMPLSMLIGLGGERARRRTPGAQPSHVFVGVEEASRPFRAKAVSSPMPAAPRKPTCFRQFSTGPTTGYVVQPDSKVLEKGNIKLSSVATDVLGVSGRAVLAKLVAGEQDPKKLADLARSRLRGNGSN
jgi:hypothetical protein